MVLQILQTELRRQINNLKTFQACQLGCVRRGVQKKTRLPRRIKKPFKKLIEQRLGKKVKNSFLVSLYNSQKDFKRKKFEPFPLEFDKDGNLPITNKRDWVAMLMNGKGCAIRPEYGASIILDNIGI